MKNLYYKKNFQKTTKKKFYPKPGHGSCLYSVEENSKQTGPLMGKMSALWLETILVGNIGNGVNGAIFTGVLECSLYCNGLLFSSYILYLSGFAVGNAMAGFVTAKYNSDFEETLKGEEGQIFLRVIVSFHSNVIAVVFNDDGVFSVVVLGSSKSYDEEGSNGNYL